MATDRSFLEKHGNQYRVRVKVPARLVPIIGSTKLVRGLGTDSLAKANLLKGAIVTEFKTSLAEAERRREAQAGSAASAIVQEANEFLAALEKANADPDYATVLEDGEVIRDGPSAIRDLAGDRAEELRRSHDSATAALFHGIATGEATPMLLHIDSYFAEAAMKPRQVLDYRRAVEKFDRWLIEKRKAATVQAVTTKIAGEYVTKAFTEQNINWKTANKDISAISSYWKWLIKKGHTEQNPWQGQSFKKLDTPDDEKERPFTDAEIVILFTGDAGRLAPDPLVREFMLIAALTGMRIDEIARMQARDVTIDTIKVRLAKTKAGQGRLVPVHSYLKPLIERRLKGKNGEDTLFPELPIPKPGSAIERSSPVSKAFTAYRRKLGVDEVVKGKRISLVVFHSFRRWFIRKAHDALIAGATGFSFYTIAEVVGHKTEAMDLGMTKHYAGLDPMKAKRACVEAVKLPKELRISI